MSLFAGAQEKDCKDEICSIIPGIKKVGSSWDLAVVAYLLDGPRRFSEILRLGKTEKLNSHTLSRVLKQLGEIGLAKRSIVETQPLAVDYSLTANGVKLRKLLDAYREIDELVVVKK